MGRSGRDPGASDRQYRGTGGDWGQRKASTPSPKTHEELLANYAAVEANWPVIEAEKIRRDQLGRFRPDSNGGYRREYEGDILGEISPNMQGSLGVLSWLIAAGLAAQDIGCQCSRYPDCGNLQQFAELVKQDTEIFDARGKLRRKVSNETTVAIMLTQPQYRMLEQFYSPSKGAARDR